MQCASCHNEVPPQAAFCSVCGAQLNTPPEIPPVQPAGGYNTVPGGTAPFAAGSGLSPNAAAAISYLTFIPAIIFLVLEPYDRMPLVRFHSVQCLALTVTAMILQIGLSILQVLFHFAGLWIIFSLLHLIVGLAIFIGWLVAILKASKGEYYKLPIIGDIAAKQANI